MDLTGGLLARKTSWAETVRVPSLSEVKPDQVLPMMRVGVVGVGVIGGSIARAARREGCDVLVYDSDPDTMRLVVESGFKVADSPSGVCLDRDVVFLCVPVDQMHIVAPMLRAALEPDCVVTDVASVKQAVRALPGMLGSERVPVVLGHPMAGSHLSGFGASSEDLFDGCTWLLCDDPHASGARRLAYLVTRLGSARVLACPLDLHDTLTAVVSHLPQVAASVLAATVGEAVEEYASQALSIAGGGFRDTTRIAESPFAMWAPILSANRSMVSMLLESYADNLKQVAAAIATDDANTVGEVFSQAAACRSRWRQAQPNHADTEATRPPVPSMWSDPHTGETAWLDRSAGWETVRTSVAQPDEHALLSTRFLAEHAGMDSDAVTELAVGGKTNGKTAALTLLSVGVPVEHRETWTADGFQVDGVVFPDGRFIVVV